VLDDPFTGGDVGANRTRDKLPSIVGDRSIIFFFHGMAPGWISEGSADGGGHQRERESMKRWTTMRDCHQHPEVMLHPRGHWMRVD
jgi:hypothetical protein